MRLDDFVTKTTPADLVSDCCTSTYSGVVLSSDTKIRELGVAAKRLIQQADPSLSPEFFLASASIGWRPRVVAIYCGCEVVGVLYAKERVLAGIPSGIVYADGSLSSPLLGDPRHQLVFFRVAVESLLAHPGIRGALLRVPHASDEFEAVKQFASSTGLDSRYSDLEFDDSTLWKSHAHLALSGTYEEFLEGLGCTTRHNFRRYRRRFEAAGYSWVERLSSDELHSAVSHLAPKTKYYDAASLTRVETQLNMVAAIDRPLAMGLKHHTGEWLSVLGGWYKPRGAVFCFQYNNDQEFGQYSLSLVLRTYLIEHLIAQKLKELVIWGGSGPPLSRYVTYVPTIVIRFDKPTFLWRTTRRVIATIRPHLPSRWAEAAQWLA